MRANGQTAVKVYLYKFIVRLESLLKKIFGVGCVAQYIRIAVKNVYKNKMRTLFIRRLPGCDARCLS